MSTYNIVAASEECTVVTEYIPEYGAAGTYQSEADLEQEFIKILSSQGYGYISIPDEAALIANLRRQLELLNGYTFTDEEWEWFFAEYIASANEGIVEKTRRIQTDPVQVLHRKDGTFKNITLLDKDSVHNNRLQVINQYEETRGARATRYDVTILVNGFPTVHVELKRRGIAIREAFNQINRYQRDSFWAASGLYEYVQIFVISNGTHTKYYSNTTRDSHVREQGLDSNRRTRKTSHSFEFTSYWADAKNKVIPDLVDFTKTFFTRHTFLNVLAKYCVFTAEDKLLVMRPYQIAATERILTRINISSNYKTTGSKAAGGYIWHTTGSGKTLTSFKTAQLATFLPFIDKVLFVVDRKDLDYQTIKEYERFKKGAANSNTSTRVLQEQLEDPGAKIIITTIQKLDRFIGRNKSHPVYKQHVVIIFDECHRSQFGEMHKAIIKSFKKYHLFGFTGTPIFAINAPSGGNPLLSTTEQVFGDQLHTYTIVDAINDGNVLPFRIDFVDTIKMPDHIKDKQVPAIDRERALQDPRRIRDVVGYILEHFDQKTKRSHFYIHTAKWDEGTKSNMIERREQRRVAGFNSIFAVSSIPVAMKYYTEFKKQLAAANRNLNIATIYSFSPNEEAPEGILADETFDAADLDQTSRDFLDSAITDYNRVFGTNFDTSADKFEGYYKDVSLRVKNKEIDLLLVVNMFLTGFDATTLNTLWVDKNLRQHGLIQAFSRTNRILNSIKTFGNIVCFRDLKEATDRAIALFGDENAGGIVLLKTYEEYYNGCKEDNEEQLGYKDLVAQLLADYPLGNAVVGEEAQKGFIRLYGRVLRLVNILTVFDEFEGNEILSERQFQDYQSRYIDLYQEFKRSVDKESINDDIIFEIELVQQIAVNIDYILMLVAKYHDSHCLDKEILVTIDKAIGSSLELRSKKELIERFIAEVSVSTNVDEDWRRFVLEQKEADLAAIIEEENLKSEETKRFTSNMFRDGSLKTTGTEIDNILPPVSLFSNQGRDKKKYTVVAKLQIFFEKYNGLVRS